ncbi:MAG TPA: VOC family protein [Allosphingosinicella sp.]|nr:VOC family protein [Allosphingosinicella sp.]
MDKVTPCLWFDGNAEEAANFYVSLLPDSRIDEVVRSPGDYPSGKAGDVILVDFTIAGRKYSALNGGPEFKFNEAVSFIIHCDDQAEVDRLWAALVADGGEEVQCGWLKDRFGLSWQVTPERMFEMLASPDREAAKRAFDAMMTMVKLDLPTLERAFADE